MKRIAAGVIFILLLGVVAKPQGMSVYSTFNPNSTEGSYSGNWYFSFSTNDFTAAGAGHPDWSGQWNTTSCSLSFTDATCGAVISVNFQVGGIESANEFSILSTINVHDPAFGTISGGLGDSGGAGSQQDSTLIYPGQPTSLNGVTNQDNFSYHSWTLGSSGIGQVQRIENISFDGTSGSGGGSWLVSYAAPVPEPATVAQLGIGAMCLCLARYFRRR